MSACIKKHVILLITSSFLLSSFAEAQHTIKKKVKQYHYAANKRDDYIYFKETIGKCVVEYNMLFEPGIITSFPVIHNINNYSKDKIHITINKEMNVIANDNDTPFYIPDEIGQFTYQGKTYIYIAEQMFSYTKMHGWKYLVFKKRKFGYTYLHTKGLEKKCKNLKLICTK